MQSENLQLSELIRDNSPKKIFKEGKSLIKSQYKRKVFRIIQKCFKKTFQLFNGKFPGYKACNTEYHNLEHTMDAFIASVRLLDGYNLENKKLSDTLATNLLIATLLHDTGYIQESWDNEGTGAKFTSNHVQRSISFLEKHGPAFKLEERQVQSIARLIKCTGLSTDLQSIPFDSHEEKIAGCMLGTADIIGQMSNRAYLEKLLFLYYEFKEANIPGLDSEFDILKNTIAFYKITKDRMKKDYMNCFEYAQTHFHQRLSIDRNLYMDAINRQINYISKIIKDDSTNFRHKLKRGEWIHYIQSENVVVNKMKFPLLK